MNIFICLTPLHFYIAYVEAQNLYQNKKEYSYIWLKYPYDYDVKTEYLHIKTYFINNSTILRKILNYINYVCFTNFCKLGEILKKCDTLYIFNEGDPITKAAIKKVDRRVKVVALEEGNGTWTDFRIAYHERIDEVRVGFVKEYKNSHPQFNGTVKAIKYSELFSVTNVKGFLNYIGFDKMDIRNVANQVLFLGQPFEPQKKYREAVEKIFSFFPNDVNLYIKPHPREREDFYDEIIGRYRNIYRFDTNANIIPIECLTCLCSIKCVITVASSAAIYLNYINPDLPIILLGNIYSGYFNVSLEAYIKPYITAIKNNPNSRNLFFPNSNEEFRLILEEVLG